MDAYLDHLRALVATHGIAIQGVLADQDGPGFSYTVGLAPHGHPELLIAALPPTTAQALLNDLGLRVLAGTLTLAAGDTVHDLLSGYPARLIAVTDSSDHLTAANALYGDPDRAPVPALQVIYPDADGRWPWEPGSKVAGMLLTGPPDQGTGTAHTLSTDPLTT